MPPRAVDLGAFWACPAAPGGRFPSIKLAKAAVEELRQRYAHETGKPMLILPGGADALKMVMVLLKHPDAEKLARWDKRTVVVAGSGKGGVAFWLYIPSTDAYEMVAVGECLTGVMDPYVSSIPPRRDIPSPQQLMTGWTDQDCLRALDSCTHPPQ